MSRGRLLIVIGIIAAVPVCIGGLVIALAILAGELAPSIKRARVSVAQIVFVGQGRVIIRNELRDVFASDLRAEEWEAFRSGPTGIAVAEGGQLWGAYGWNGYEGGPEGTVWHSSDGGSTWSKTEIELPSGDGLLPGVQARLPGEFINGPSDPPLLLMFNLQLMRPKPGTDVAEWEVVGRPIPGAKPLQRWSAAGLGHRNVIYVAVDGMIHMSTDQAVTWTGQAVHSFFDAELSCREDQCFALLSELGSKWSGLVSTEPGSNGWKPFGTLELPAVAGALADQAAEFGPVQTFGATALAVTSDRVYIAGIVNAGGSAWGAVLLIERDGQLRSLKGAVQHGLWVLATGPDGTLWAGGKGAYTWAPTGWNQVWPSR